ncbi:MAG: KpsF/GutQ family sugar-phosphate isomerase [Planctomycetota bacterium]|nr:KpsF/GutQ family sugar-phosphate isomerase [Planctomycetota bacterium]MDP6762712.1 KpsF/GutQ family sugar-phosphate isomerase [Planctomycetota bacterium]
MEGSSPSPRERRDRAAEVIRSEARAIAELEGLLDESFSRAVDMTLACEGLLVVTGMGKAGLVGQKISATLASTGTPSLFLHPAEALHGDLGRVREQDVLLALSNSGETAEVNATLPTATRIGAGVVAMTGRPDSAMARLADCVLDIGRVEEACPLRLAPTASTSAMLALGDALAMVVLAERGFDREDYARFHPAGNLGRRLMPVGEVMRKDQELPLVPSGAAVREVLITMSNTPGRPGAALVVDEAGSLVGIFTDGNLRRMLESGRAGHLDVAVDEFMGCDPKTIGPQEPVESAQRLLQAHRVDQIPVLDGAGRPVGLLDVQDLLDIRP